MIQEINNFMDTLPPSLKEKGIKPKEGIHVLLRLLKSDDGDVYMDSNSLEKVITRRERQNLIILSYSVVLIMHNMLGV